MGVSCRNEVGGSKWEGGGVTPSVLEMDDLEMGLCEVVLRRVFGEGEGDGGMGDGRAEVRFVFCKDRHVHH